MGAIAALAIACSTAPPEPLPPPLHEPLPAQWAGAEAQPVSAHAWWLTLDATHLPPLIDEALAHNHDLLAAEARLDAAAAQAVVAGAPRWPQVDASFETQRQRQVFVGLPIPGSAPGEPLSRTFSRYGVSLGIGWELDLWGRLRAGAAAALAEVQASRADLEAARHSLAAQTARAWFAAIAARLQVELAERTVHTYATTLGNVQERFARGTRPSADLRLADSNQASARALLEERREQRARALLQLETLLGRMPRGDLAAAGALPPPPPQIPAGLPAELLRRRPDLIAAERRLAAQDRRLAQASAALYPRLSLTGSAGTTSQELGDLLDPDFLIWSLLGNLAQPVFRGGQLRAEVELAFARRRELAQGYAQAVLRALQEVEAALAAERFLREREVHQQRAAEQAEAARELIERRYQDGVVELVAVLDAQRRALEADSQLLEVRRLRLDTRITLHLALGGGFDASAGAAPVAARGTGVRGTGERGTGERGTGARARG